MSMNSPIENSGMHSLKHTVLLFNELSADLIVRTGLVSVELLMELRMMVPRLR